MKNSEIQLILLASIYFTVGLICAIIYIKRKKGKGATKALENR